MASSSSAGQKAGTVEYRKWPPALRERLGEAAGTALADVFEERSNELQRLVTEHFERLLSEECRKLRDESGVLRTELRDEIRDQCAALRVELSGVKADFIKWSFLFWIGQAATVAALFVALR